MGTTIMACVYDGGVILGADSRTSTGTYVANRVTDKLTKVAEHIYCCRSGSAADTQAIADIVRYYLDVHSIDINEEPEVATAANLFQDFCYKYKNSLSASIIVAGWDPHNGASIYAIPLGGTCVKQPFAVGGSGSIYIYGQVDKNFRENMGKEEALHFVRTSIALAMSRDGSSGGLIRTACITQDGVEREVVPGNKLPKFYEA
eukprot:TRINITY_DN72260_c2_g2_i1.p1 TRINITY_DN72260_c2_g2~~TRINITY_DN72260_c2_g2_i1.p1  ORF type:complete len:235 (-),score=36.60 TRINITY_DN72260_c2_g2_i1:165-773(-)